MCFPPYLKDTGKALFSVEKYVKNLIVQSLQFATFSNQRHHKGCEKTIFTFTGDTFSIANANAGDFYANGHESI